MAPVRAARRPRRPRRLRSSATAADRSCASRHTPGPAPTATRPRGAADGARRAWRQFVRRRDSAQAVPPSPAMTSTAITVPQAGKPVSLLVAETGREAGSGVVVRRAGADVGDVEAGFAVADRAGVERCAFGCCAAWWRAAVRAATDDRAGCVADGAGLATWALDVAVLRVGWAAWVGCATWVGCAA